MDAMRSSLQPILYGFLVPPSQRLEASPFTDLDVVESACDKAKLAWSIESGSLISEPALDHCRPGGFNCVPSSDSPKTSFLLSILPVILEHITDIPVDR